MILISYDQTFAYQVSGARIVSTVFVGEVCSKHGVSTYRHFDGKILSLPQEVCFLQT